MITIMLGALIFGAVALSIFWQEIKSFIQTSWDKIKEIVTPAAIAGFNTFLQTGNLTAATLKTVTVAIQKFYSKTERNQWKETIITQKISTNELPEDIKRKLEKSKGKEININQDVIKELKLEI